MAKARPPSLVVIAGPNGAGKSTLAPVLLRDALEVIEFVNADVIARGLSGFAPDTMAIAAGRLMLTRVRELAEQRASFAFETTLASRSFAPWIRRLIDEGISVSSRVPLVAERRARRAASRQPSPDGRTRRSLRRCQAPIWLGPAKLLRHLPSAGDDVAAVRQRPRLDAQTRGRR